MLSGIASHSMLIAAKSSLLQTRNAQKSLDDGSGLDGSRTIPLTKQENAAATEALKAATEKPGGETNDLPPAKRVVDQRTTETPLVRITVISYSDGSSETLHQMKKIGQVAAAATHPTAFEGHQAFKQRGTIVDRLG